MEKSESAVILSDGADASGGDFGAVSLAPGEEPGVDIHECARLEERQKRGEQLTEQEQGLLEQGFLVPP